MKRLPYFLALCVFLVGTTLATANSISTLYAGDNGGSAGGAVYFDITIGSSDITITGFDTNTTATVPFAFTVYITAAGGTYIGNLGSAAAWSVAATGNGTGLGDNNPTPVALSNAISLLANTTYGIALVMGPEASHRYTNGTGSNRSYSNADLSLSLGAASNVPFNNSPFSPRVWNGTINNDLGGTAVPEPSTWTMLLTGAVAGLIGIRRRKRSR